MDNNTKKQPKIKDGKLIINAEEIDIERLAELMDIYDSESIVNNCLDLIASLGQLGLYVNEVSINAEEIRSMLPGHSTVYFLKQMAIAFRK